MSLYSVVVPVYNSEHTLQELYTRLEKVFREVIKEEFELIGKKFWTASGASVWICTCER